MSEQLEATPAREEIFSYAEEIKRKVDKAIANENQKDAIVPEAMPPPPGPPQQPLMPAIRPVNEVN